MYLLLECAETKTSLIAPKIVRNEYFLGSLTSTDSGNGSFSTASHGAGSDSVQSIPTSTSGCSVYHVASSIVHNSPGAGNMSLPIKTLNQQRRHSAMAGE